MEKREECLRKCVARLYPLAHFESASSLSISFVAVSLLLTRKGGFSLFKYLAVSHLTGGVGGVEVKDSRPRSWSSKSLSGDRADAAAATADWRWWWNCSASPTRTQMLSTPTPLLEAALVFLAGGAAPRDALPLPPAVTTVETVKGGRSGGEVTLSLLLSLGALGGVAQGARKASGVGCPKTLPLPPRSSPLQEPKEDESPPPAPPKMPTPPNSW